MKKIYFLFAMQLLATVAYAQDDSQTGYNFLRLPVSAHAAALGENNISLIDDDITLAFHNPALLTSVNDKTANLNFMTYMEGSTVASASFNRVINDKASWAAMGQFINYGTMKQTDVNNNILGEFSAKDIAIGGCFSYVLTDKIVGGLNAKFMTSYIGDYSAVALGVDLGLNYYDPEKELSVSLVAKNLGGEVKAYDDTYSKLPADLQLGVTKRLMNGPLRFSATLADMTNWDYKFINHVSAGLDIILSPQIYVAGGYNFRRYNEMGINSADEEKPDSHGSGMSFGAGLMLERFKLNVSYAKYHVSSTSLMINVSL